MPANPTELLAEQVQLLQGIQAELKQLTTQEANTADNVARLHQTVAALNAQVELATQDRSDSSVATAGVNVVDVSMSLSAMVGLILKWAAATFLAGLILVFLFGLVSIVLSLIFRTNIRLF